MGMGKELIFSFAVFILLGAVFAPLTIDYAFAGNDRNLMITVFQSDGKTKAGGADCRIIVFSAANTVIQTKNLVANGGGNINTNMVETGRWVQVDCTLGNSSGLDVASVNGGHTVHMNIYIS